MNSYFLNVSSPIIGGYFSSEQVDLLRIVMCNSFDELYDYIDNCDQINHLNIKESIKDMDLESAKRFVFKSYQDTLIIHDSNREADIRNKLKHCGLLEEDIDVIINGVLGKTPMTIPLLRDFVKSKYPNNYEKIFTMTNHFASLERDQLKDENLYDEMVELSSNLDSLNSILVGSGRIYNVVNELFDEDNHEKRFDYYHATRDLDFAYTHGKQVRFHSLLCKETGIFEGKTKDEILDFIRQYVERTIDFIAAYNKEHKVIIDGKEEPVINAVDLFNEIISFEHNQNGEYTNIWYERFGISINDLIEHCFKYALDHKPEGVSFLYNEPFLENDERRKKVLETLEEIRKIAPGLIDTLGSQMHITIGEDPEKIRRCFEDFKKLQESGLEIQITEFDMSLGSRDIPRVFGPNADVSLEDVYSEKERKIREISNIINASGVKLSGVSYWSLTDGIDCNLERIRSKYLEEGKIKDIKEIPSACGGLIPTHKKLIKKNELEEMFNEEETNETKEETNQINM